MRGLQPRGEANKRGITPNQVVRENGGKRELGSIGTAGENRPALDRSTAQPLPRSPFSGPALRFELEQLPNQRQPWITQGAGPACRALRSACSLLPLWVPDDETHKYSESTFLIFPPGTKAAVLSEANLQELPPTTRYRTCSKVPSAQELKFQLSGASGRWPDHSGIKLESLPRSRFRLRRIASKLARRFAKIFRSLKRQRESD